MDSTCKYYNKYYENENLALLMEKSLSINIFLLFLIIRGTR